MYMQSEFYYRFRFYRGIQLRKLRVFSRHTMCHLYNKIKYLINGLGSIAISLKVIKESCIY